ncbi:anaerobic benzoate catabolism transcriptional regulator [Streptomyces sp. YIM 121038]|uniref:helix-turn-helix domain-containing protein n=1 Tax=Streptomyces sp. YIM 121038 TaxID=2136401 RepID=UPI0011103FCC|nr:helix-turn-helix transcriptional regulator [Streptomyces sp. YIM 121038]QCX81152.1 anaerobic benzoate catabolism transcriptional regulator [Streptomyces sp. YIM 121038]
MERPPTYTVNGAEIRRLRMQAGLTTEELARKAQISRRYLGHLETGYRTRMRPDTYAGLRTALGLPADSRQLLDPTEGTSEKR